MFRLHQDGPIWFIVPDSNKKDYRDDNFVDIYTRSPIYFGGECVNPGGQVFIHLGWHLDALVSCGLHCPD